jgi:aminoglycoside phosphotransferase (APT) family kinase protein
MSGSIADFIAAAARRGLSLTPEGARLDTMGLDFVVLHARDAGGTPWIVRSPRRPDVAAAAAIEARVLARIAPHVPFAVPDWRIHDPELIAYPRIPGTPAVTLDTGAPVWNVIDPAAPSDTFIASYASAIAALQRVPSDDLPIETIADARAKLEHAIDVARDLLAPSATILTRWRRFLDGDTWPAHLALTHGDLHPGHMLLDATGRLTGVIDWTEAKLSDPVLDIAMFAGCFGRAALDRFVPLFERAGGRTWPSLIDHALERWAIWPALGAEWAHRTNNPGILDHVRAQLAALEES